MSQRFKDAAAVSRGLQKVAQSAANRNIRKLNEKADQWNSSDTRRTLEESVNVENTYTGLAKYADPTSIGPKLMDSAERAKMVGIGLFTLGRLVTEGVFPGKGGITQNPYGASTSDLETPGNDPSHRTKAEPYSSTSTGNNQTDIDFTEAIEEVVLKDAAAMHTAGQSLATPEEVSTRVQEIFDTPSTGNSTETIAQTTSSPQPKPLAEFTEDFLSSHELKLNEGSKERRVPSSRIGRVTSFASLGVGLGMGALAEMGRKSLGLSKAGKDVSDSLLNTNSNPFLTEANIERIVNTLCRVRGAALKLGQMISIQDNALISPQLQKIFERVRYSADFMPKSQVFKAMKNEFGGEWRDLFTDFHEEPFAAASIGQVHQAVTKDGKDVALKIQYPGVAESIDSDIDNLMSVAGLGRIFPKGAYVEDAVHSARRELRLECDYEREANASKLMKTLVSDDPNYYVPEVFDNLTTKQVLTSELVYGTPVDKCTDLDQVTRNWIGERILELCMRELFEFRFMQTDPNWANFLYQQTADGQRRIVLLDFGASRPYKKEFVDPYMKILMAAGVKDKEGILKHSKEVGLLTGYETKVMEDAHVDAVLILGEALATDKPFDFGAQDITRRISRIIPIMAEHRLTPPPEEIYSLHRKLSGAFLLCAKLRSAVHCWPVFRGFADNYQFGPTPTEEYPQFVVPL